jgi:hypothetical protein
VRVRVPHFDLTQRVHSKKVFVFAKLDRHAIDRVVTTTNRAFSILRRRDSET